jgi:RHS repeat-associated protein
MDCKGMGMKRITMLVAGIGLVLAANANAGTEVTFRLTYEYDDYGRLVAERGNNGQVTLYTYDNEDRVTTVTDALNRITRLTHDARARLTGSVDAGGATSAFAYDTNDQPVSVTDPRGTVTTFERDGFGQIWKQTSPDSGVTLAEYDVAGLRTRLTRGNGSITTTNYDGLGRLTQAKAGQVERNYSYDTCSNGVGRLCAAEMRENGAIKNWAAHTYNPQGWLTQRWDGGVDDAGQSYDGAIAYAYNGAGQVTGISYPSGISVGYGYHTGQPTTITVTISGSVQTVASNITHRPYGQAEGWVYGNGLVRLYHYDTDGRMFGIGDRSGDTLVQSLTYGFNAADEIVAITNGMDAGQTRAYQYDALGRLAKETAKGAEWYYDTNGNRTRALEAGAQTTYVTDPSSNRLMSYSNPTGTRNYGYDAVGNRTAETAPGLAAGYGYDGFNRLRSATVNGVTSTYIVNALDQRVGKKTSIGQTRFVYSGQNQLLAENGPSGWTSYLWMGDELIGLVKPDQQLRYVHNDHLGRPEVVTDSVKQVVWRADNEAWGRSIKLDAIDGLNLGFPGQYYDSEIGLWQNGFRDGYDAKLGSFTQSDPIGLAGGSYSTYAYAGGDPIDTVDQFGLSGRKGERGATRSAGGTQNPGKHWKDDPKNPGWGWQKDSQTGKKTYKRVPPFLRSPNMVLPLFFLQESLRHQCEGGDLMACESYCALTPGACEEEPAEILASEETYNPEVIVVPPERVEGSGRGGSRDGGAKRSSSGGGGALIGSGCYGKCNPNPTVTFGKLEREETETE